MALTDVVFGGSNSSLASRGNTGTLSDMVFSRTTGLVSPTFYGGYWSVTASFKDSNDDNLPDGVRVNAFHATTHLYIGTGLISGGSVTIQVTTSANVYLVVDPSDLTGETVCTTAITPS